MKCQILFSGKNKKNISKCHLLKILPRVLSVKDHLLLTDYLTSMIAASHLGDIRILLDLDVRDQLLVTGYTRYHTFESAYSKE